MKPINLHIQYTLHKKCVKKYLKRNPCPDIPVKTSARTFSNLMVTEVMWRSELSTQLPSLSHHMALRCLGEVGVGHMSTGHQEAEVGRTPETRSSRPTLAM